jgi:predicted nucleic acid-binding protein
MNEQRASVEETEGVRKLMKCIDDGEVRMITSELTRAEVLRCTLSADAQSKFDAVLQRRNVGVMNTDHFTWKLTHDLRDYYQAQKRNDRLRTLTVPDAVHLATALQYEVDIFYTFDEKNGPRGRRGLIPLNGDVAGFELKIIKPLGEPDLFTAATRYQSEEDEEE